MATHTVKQSLGDFSTLASALADAGTVNSDTISIEGAWSINDTAAATVSDNSITIQADSSSKVDITDLLSPSHYRLRVASSHALTINGDDCIVDGIEISQTGTGSSDEGIRLSGSDSTQRTYTIKNTVSWADGRIGSQDGIYIYQGGTTGDPSIVNLENVVIFGYYRGGIHLQNWDAEQHITLNINSSTSVDNGPAGPADSTAGCICCWCSNSLSVLKLNIFNTLTAEDSSGSACFNSTQAYSGTTDTWDIHECIDSDASIDSRDTGASGCLTNRTLRDSSSGGDEVLITDYSGSVPWDVSLVDDSTNNDAQEMHTSSSGAGLSVPLTDIAGTTRSSSYDCGCWHVDSAPTLRPKFNPFQGSLSGPFGGPI